MKTLFPRTLFLSSFACLVFFNASANAEPVDLSDWLAEGQNGNWVLQPGNNSVLQTVNGFPTVFHNDEDSQGMQLSGTIEVQTEFDNDFVGFVLGYDAGDLDNPNPDYLVIDWRQQDQDINGCISQAGLAAIRVTESIASFGGTACRDSAGVEELARANSLGDAGWADFVQYTFDLVFTQNVVQIFVDGALEINIAGNFSNGSFGFYNSSQAAVLYAGIEEDVAVIILVPEPVPLALLGIGLAGLGLSRRRKRR